MMSEKLSAIPVGDLIRLQSRKIKKPAKNTP